MVMLKFEPTDLVCKNVNFSQSKHVPIHMLDSFPVQETPDVWFEKKEIHIYDLALQRFLFMRYWLQKND